MKTKLAIIGENVSSYSNSPLIHNKWLAQNKLPYHYQALDLKAGEFHKMVSLLKSEYIGCNITIPFKQEVTSYLDSIDPIVKEINSVNVIKNINNKLMGFNTDIFGFRQALKNILEETAITVNTAIIFGTGGSAKAAYYSLLAHFKLSKIIIVSRTTNIINLNIKSLPFSKIVYTNYQEYKQYLASTDLIVNTTPRSTSIELFSFSGIRNQTIMFDLNYNNEESNFIKIAKKYSKIVKDGNEMLIYQAAESFRIWFDIFPIVIINK